MVRICPQCKAHLSSSSYYFCNVCGEVLPTETINAEIPLKVKMYKLNDTTPHIYIELRSAYKKYSRLLFNKHMYYLYIVSVVLIVLGLSVNTLNDLFYKYFGKNLIHISTIVPSFISKSQNTITEDVDLSSVTFGMDNLADYVPAKAELYIEAGDVKKLLSAYGNVQFYDSPVSTIFTHLNKNVALFKVDINGKMEWGVIDKLASVDDVTPVVDLVKSMSNPFWKFKVIGDVLVIASNDQIFNVIADAKNKYSLSLALSSKYVIAKDKLPTVGKGLVIFFSDQGKTEFANIAKYVQNSAINKLVEDVVNSGYNDVVIN